MKLKSTIFKGLAVLMLAGGAGVSANAITLEVPQQGNWGWHEISFSNVRYIFQVNEDEVWNEETQETGYKIADEAYLWRVEAYGNYIDLELPSHITVCPYSNPESTKTVPVTCLGFPYDHSQLYDCWNVNFIIPETYTKLVGFHEDNYHSITLLSSQPPLLWDMSGNVTFEVSDEAYPTYLSYKENNQNGWENVKITKSSSQAITIDNNPGGLLNALESISEIDGDFSIIKSLTVKGGINGRDMNVFSMLSNLRDLDLSGVTVYPNDREDQFITGCRELRYLKTVKLPASVTTIDSECFRDCYSLTSINLGNITKFDNYAFTRCFVLNNIDLSNAREIRYEAFHECYNLESVVISKNIERMDSYAFSHTALSSFNIPENARLGSYVFQNTNIKELTFYHNDLIEDRAFAYMDELEHLYCFDPVPHTNSFSITNPKTVLHVPAFSIDNYINSANYENVLRIDVLNQDVNNISLRDRNFTLTSTEDLANPFNLEIGKDAAFVNESGENLNINNFVQYARYGASTNYEQNESSSSLYSTYFISNSKTEAKSAEVNLSLMNSNFWSGSDAWNFISFPFNVDIKDIVTPDDALWAIREYNGAERAANPYDGTSKWINKTSGTLEAGKGYILHFTADYIDENKIGNGYDYGMNYFKFPAVKDSKLNNLFAYGNVKVALNYYDSEFEHNKSWNLVGNPYDAYYDINGIKYSSASGVSRVPITVWRKINGSFTYEAFSADDDYTLLPFEAFFVQAIDKDNVEMEFQAKGRITGNIAPRSFTNDPVAGTNRSIFNLYISSENSSDRTRLVINDEASVNYEISCDASKFLAPDPATAQIYMLENNEKFAINERPFGDGLYKFGVRIAQQGIYTIKCDTRNADGYDVILVDTFTGKETSLINNEYSFNADQGSDDRFRIRLIGSTNGNGETTGIEDVNAAKASISINGQNVSVSAAGEIEIYSIDGKVVAAGTDNLNVSLPAGMYVIKTAEESVKAVVR